MVDSGMTWGGCASSWAGVIDPEVQKPGQDTANRFSLLVESSPDKTTKPGSDSGWKAPCPGSFRRTRRLLLPQGLSQPLSSKWEKRKEERAWEDTGLSIPSSEALYKKNKTTTLYPKGQRTKSVKTQKCKNKETMVLETSRQGEFWEGMWWRNGVAEQTYFEERSYLG